MFLAIVLASQVLAQSSPGAVTTAAPLPMAAPMYQPLENGPCLDSPRPVPQVLMPPVSREMQIVRIDKVESTATLMPGEIIGYLYTLADGSTWLGQRSQQYMSGASASAVNLVLASTHMPGQNISVFPPQMRQGVATKYTQFFRVQIPPGSFGTLRITIVPCVAWPAARPLPDPMM